MCTLLGAHAQIDNSVTARNGLFRKTKEATRSKDDQYVVSLYLVTGNTQLLPQLIEDLQIIRADESFGAKKNYPRGKMLSAGGTTVMLKMMYS